MFCSIRYCGIKAPFAFLTSHTLLQSFQMLFCCVGIQDLMHIIAYLQVGFKCPFFPIVVNWNFFHKISINPSSTFVCFICLMQSVCIQWKSLELNGRTPKAFSIPVTFINIFHLVYFKTGNIKCLYLVKLHVSLGSEKFIYVQRISFMFVREGKVYTVLTVMVSAPYTLKEGGHGMESTLST